MKRQGGPIPHPRRTEGLHEHLPNQIWLQANFSEATESGTRSVAQALIHVPLTFWFTMDNRLYILPVKRMNQGEAAAEAEERMQFGWQHLGS